MSFKAVLGVLFGLLVVAIGFLAFTTFQYNDQVIHSSYLVNHSHEVLDNADGISSLFKDLLLESNGFYIANDTSLTAPYKKASTVLLDRAENLALLALDHRQQAARVDSLKKLLHKLKIFTDSTFVLEPKYISSHQMLKRIRESNKFRADIRNVIDNIKEEEETRLTKYVGEYQQNIVGFKRTVSALLMGTALLVVSTFFVVRYNLNKRLSVEDQLKNANELFAKLFYESPIAIVLSEEQTGVIVNCNEVFSKTVNIPKFEVLGKTAASLGIFDNPEQRDQIVAAVKRTWMTKYTEVYITPRNKEKIWVSISAESIIANDKKCLLSAIMDLSMHKRAEDEIKKALKAEVELNRLKSNFVTLASHEFRTPLTTILSSAFLLDNFTPENEKAKKHIARIKSAVNNLTSILDEFLSVTKIEEGQVHANFEKLDVKNFLAATCNNLQAFAKPGQTIIYTHSGETEANTDPVLLANIVNNLVSNSMKYSPENTRILVSSNVNSKIHLSVTDTGIGIPEEDQEHLFERFYRASNAGTVQGTGLGLHIMKHYVDMLHGSVSVTSEVGKGTRVEVTLESK